MTDMDESATSLGRREKMAPVRIEIDLVQDIKDELDELMNVRVDEIEYEDLKEFYAKVKAQYKTYTRRAVKLKDRLLELGHVNDSENCRGDIMEASGTLKSIRQVVTVRLEQGNRSSLGSSIASSTQRWVDSQQPMHAVTEEPRSPSGTNPGEFYHTAEVHTGDIPSEVHFQSSNEEEPPADPCTRSNRTYSCGSEQGRGETQPRSIPGSLNARDMVARTSTSSDQGSHGYGTRLQHAHGIGTGPTSNANPPGPAPGGPSANPPGPAPGGYSANPPGPAPGGSNATPPGPAPGGSGAKPPGPAPGGPTVNPPGPAPGGSAAGNTSAGTFYNPTQGESDAMRAMSRHLLQQDMLRDAIPVYGGDPMHFWSWRTSIESYVEEVQVSPLHYLKLMIRFTENDPQAYLRGKLLAVGLPNKGVIDDIMDELTERYGSSHLIAAHLRQRISEFPAIKDQNDGEALLRLFDLCDTIEANLSRCPELSDMHHATGLSSIRVKLPFSIQNSWAKRGFQHELRTKRHPPFTVFNEFLREQAKQRSNHNYKITREDHKEARSSKGTDTRSRPSKGTRALKTESRTEGRTPAQRFCHLHGKGGHTLSQCLEFRKLDDREKQNLVRQKQVCRRCLEHHPGEGCKIEVRCETCGKTGHLAAMHYRSMGRNNNHQGHYHANRGQHGNAGQGQYNNTNQGYRNNQSGDVRSSQQHGAGHSQQGHNEPKCTRLCGEPEGRNCSKTFLVDIALEGHAQTMRGYVIVDDQSPETLIDESVKDFFQREFPTQEYTMHTACQGLSMNVTGQIISGLSVKGVLESEFIPLPPSFTCKDLADTRDEVATPDTARRWPHAVSFAHKFPRFDHKAPMVALIGRNCPRAMWDRKVSKEFPYVVESHLGFALVGQTCPRSTTNGTNRVRAKKTNSIEIHRDFVKPIPNRKDVFAQCSDDEELGLSQYDKEFLDIVTDGVRVDEDGNLELPLPIKKGAKLPQLSTHVFQRSETTLNKLKRDKEKLEGCITNMQRSLESGYVEQVPIHEIRAPDANAMPIHIATHPKKGKHRVVVDPNCNYKGNSLNEALLAGPNLVNEMNGVFLRFRENRIAFGADIQDMFCQFRIPKEQRDLLRFYWFKDNDPRQIVVPYRYNTHPFGLSSSPGVANFALKLCAKRPMTEEFESAQEYLLKAFYVDDGMGSAGTVEEGIRVVSKAQEILGQNNIRLHKVMSNSRELVEAFPEGDRAESANKSIDEASQQSVLGVFWDTHKDRLSLNVNIPTRPFTKRGVLSCIGSIYDRTGLVSPVTLAGRLFQRKIMPPQGQGNAPAYDWDEELPQAYRAEYESWLESLKELDAISIPRGLGPSSFLPMARQLHVFCDASKDCIGYVSYLRSVGANGEICVTFVNACSKVAPRTATSIPRLELNAAVEGAANSAFLQRELKAQVNSVHLYTDSMIVLGYLSNKERRFSKYVERRVNLVLQYTELPDWSYVCTDQNPADIATRPHSPRELLATAWLTGPSLMLEPNCQPNRLNPGNFPELPEQKQEGLVLKTRVSNRESVTHQLSTKISRYSIILNILKRLNEIPCMRDRAKQRCGISLAPRAGWDLDRVLVLAVQDAQSDSYADLIYTLRKEGVLPVGHPLAALSPFLDDQGTVRVGGRLKNASIPNSEKYPILLHCSHPFTTVVALSLHQKGGHPGGYLTHALLRQNGYYLEKGKGFIQSLVRRCVTCRRLRGSPLEQQMADLPLDRLEEVAPFVNVGLDVFGHFLISEGQTTRKHSSQRKVWVLIVVCQPSRAVHLEPLPAMDTTAFMNAFARFEAIRGPCKLVRSDQGSNFLGALNQMEGLSIDQLKREFVTRNVKWIFNPPHASHMGGSWERKIGSVRRIMEATLVTLGGRKLSYDEFTTLLAETASIVNKTPLWATSNDPNDPLPLSPNHILTLRDKEVLNKDEYTFKDLLRYGKARYRRVQYLVEQFWTRWRREYLLTLGERRKWTRRKPCLRVGDVVLVKEQFARRNEWPTALVTSVNKSGDGLVRSATLRSIVRGLPSSEASGPARHITRPISKLILLVPGVENESKDHFFAGPGSVASNAKYPQPNIE